VVVSVFVCGPWNCLWKWVGRHCVGIMAKIIWEEAFWDHMAKIQVAFGMQRGREIILPVNI
jgi:hypothetical protein